MEREWHPSSSPANQTEKPKGEEGFSDSAKPPPVFFFVLFCFVLFCFVLFVKWKFGGGEEEEEGT